MPNDLVGSSFGHSPIEEFNERILDSGQQRVGVKAQASQSYQEQELLGSLLLEIWRLKRTAGRMADALDETQMRPLRHSLDRLDDVLAVNDVEFRMYDNEIYAEGSSLEVVHTRELGDPLVVVETLQPAISYAGRIIRQGQVILGAQGAEKE